ncbi:MAG: hypothetical protein U9Q83_10885 [Bacteroidota bacterium]|nr:hypothetical protein [Bacteroidota bacterium]
MKIVDKNVQIISKVEIVKSDTIKELNLGFYIAILGFSDDWEDEYYEHTRYYSNARECLCLYNYFFRNVII